MTKQLWIKLIVITCMLGVIGLGLNTVFGNNTVTYLHKITVNGVVFYKYDFFNYIENIRNTFTDISQLSLTLPERAWSTGNSLSDINNNLHCLANVWILIGNILVYPIRISGYIIQMILSLVGVPTTAGSYEYNNLKWLIDLTKTMTNLQIQYV